MGNPRNTSPCKPDMMFHIAQVSCISNTIASMLMGNLRNTCLYKPNKILQGANNTNLICIRQISLACNLSNATCQIDAWCMWHVETKHPWKIAHFTLQDEMDIQILIIIY